MHVYMVHTVTALYIFLPAGLPIFACGALEGTCKEVSKETAAVEVKVYYVKQNIAVVTNMIVWVCNYTA